MKAEIGKQYRHYKNKKIYVVLKLAVHTETGEKMVVYEGQYDDPEFGPNPIWVRPLAMFEERIMYEDKLTERFTVCKVESEYI